MQVLEGEKTDNPVVVSLFEKLSRLCESTDWRGHQTFPTVVSVKGGLPQKLQSQSTLSCDIIQIHSLFRHGFIKIPKSKFNRNRK